MSPDEQRTRDKLGKPEWCDTVDTFVAVAHLTSEDGYNYSIYDYSIYDTERDEQYISSDIFYDLDVMR